MIEFLDRHLDLGVGLITTAIGGLYGLLGLAWRDRQTQLTRLAACERADADHTRNIAQQMREQAQCAAAHRLRDEHIDQTVVRIFDILDEIRDGNAEIRERLVRVETKIMNGSSK